MPGHLNTNPNPSSIASPCSNANPSPSPNPSLGAVKVRPACGPGQLCVYVFILPLMCMWGGGEAGCLGQVLELWLWLWLATQAFVYG